MSLDNVNRSLWRVVGLGCTALAVLLLLQQACVPPQAMAAWPEPCPPTASYVQPPTETELYCTEWAQFLNHTLFWPTLAETCEPGTQVVTLTPSEADFIFGGLFLFANVQAALLAEPTGPSGTHTLNAAPVVGPTLTGVIAWPVTGGSGPFVTLTPAEEAFIAEAFAQLDAVQTLMRDKLTQGRRRRRRTLTVDEQVQLAGCIMHEALRVVDRRAQHLSKPIRLALAAALTRGIMDRAEELGLADRVRSARRGA